MYFHVPPEISVLLRFRRYSHDLHVPFLLRSDALLFSDPDSVLRRSAPPDNLSLSDADLHCPDAEADDILLWMSSYDMAHDSLLLPDHRLEHQYKLPNDQGSAALFPLPALLH